MTNLVALLIANDRLRIRDGKKCRHRYAPPEKIHGAIREVPGFVLSVVRVFAVEISRRGVTYCRDVSHVPRKTSTETRRRRRVAQYVNIVRDTSKPEQYSLTINNVFDVHRYVIDVPEQLGKLERKLITIGATRESGERNETNLEIELVEIFAL